MVVRSIPIEIKNFFIEAYLERCDFIIRITLLNQVYESANTDQENVKEMIEHMMEQEKEYHKKMQRKIRKRRTVSTIGSKPVP